MSGKLLNAGWLVGAVLLSSWAVSSAADERPAGRSAPAREQAAPLPPLAAEVEAEITRLAAGMESPGAAPVVRRNLFEFDVRGSKFEVQRTTFEVEVPAPAGTSDSHGSENLAPGTSNVELRTPNLTAVAEHAGALTAVISFNDALHYVKKGDVIAGRFRVDAVGAQGVELFDQVLGTILRLTLYVAA